jgi:hypothetical protein
MSLNRLATIYSREPSSSSNSASNISCDYLNKIKPGFMNDLQKCYDKDPTFANCNDISLLTSAQSYLKAYNECATPP